ncbi:hypothetical protein [Roseomonas chloroacetimidivorans]|uniref:hypothetical protein n=1 Tax=Roseomonas chloroacetimidivorans TaxID=1766656 RepID=UPI003C7234C3
MSTDSLTILQARCKLAKTISPGRIQDFDSPKHFNLVEEPFTNLAGLNDLLNWLLPRRDLCVVRGAIFDPARTRGVRRLLHRDPETGDEPTLRDVPRGWVALDEDGTPAPEGLDLRNLAACGEVARATLPEAFSAAACIVQATAGHAIKRGLRLRLWFRLERALTGAECQCWLRGVPGVDPSTLRAAQVTYTAAPVFVDMADPLPRRLAMLPGLEAVTCPTEAELQPPPRPAADPSRVASSTNGDRYVRAALMRACTNIATAPVDSRHPTAVAEAWGLARFVVAGLLTADEVIRAVDGALEQAGKPKGEGAKIAAWAVSQRTDAGNLPQGVRE